MQPNPNYEAEARRKQEEQERLRFQQQRDPFKFGQEVARRRYSEIMSGLNERRRQASRSYSDMYQAARQSAVSQQAAGGPSLTGGMRRQASDLLSAAQIQELGRIGAERERAVREIDLQKQSAFSNAQLEGQQAEQMALQGAQTKLQLVQQKNQILSDKSLNDEQKAEQLRTLGYNQEAEQLTAEAAPSDPNQGKLFQSILGFGAGATILGAGKAAAGKGFLVGAGKALGFVAAKVIPILAIAYGAEKLAELAGVNEGKGLLDFV